MGLTMTTASSSTALAASTAPADVVRGGRIVRFEQFVDTALVRDAMTADA